MKRLTTVQKFDILRSLGVIVMSADVQISDLSVDEMAIRKVAADYYTVAVNYAWVNA